MVVLVIKIFFIEFLSSVECQSLYDKYFRIIIRCRDDIFGFIIGTSFSTKTEINQNNHLTLIERERSG